ncbi:MAG: hypothetical protein AAFR27_14040, partial [Pseudomonadota bacterium]
AALRQQPYCAANAPKEQYDRYDETGRVHAALNLRNSAGQKGRELACSRPSLKFKTSQAI